MRYLDLSSLIDIEPETEDVLDLIANDDLINEFIERMEDIDFVRKFISCLGVDDINTIKSIIEENEID